MATSSTQTSLASDVAPPPAHPLPPTPPHTVATLFGNDRFYVSSSAVAGMPSFPPEWEKRPLDPAGTLNTPGQDVHEPYNVHWLEQWRVRQMFVETDLLYQFVTKVAARTGKSADTYFRGGATASDALEALMINVVTNALHQQVMADNKSLHAPDDPVALKAIDELNRAAAQFVRGAAQRVVRAGAAELAAPELPERMSEAATAQQEALFRTAVQAFQQRSATAAPGMPGGVLPKPMAPAAVAPGVTVPRRGPTVTPARAPDEMIQPPPVYNEYAVLSPAQMEERRRALKPPAAAATEGLKDPRVMLTYLLLRGGISKTEMDAVEKIYGPPQLVLRDRERIRQTLDDAQKLERMLRRSPALDWMEAPQHTGFLFFSPVFSAAVDSAVHDVHHVCGKPWALEIDLMTHDEVSADFAELVAYHLQRSTEQRLSRFGGGKEAYEQRERLHASLIRKFRKLGRTNRETPVHGMFLTFEGMDGHASRERTEQERRKYMMEQHRYYSDRYQQRPVPSPPPAQPKQASSPPPQPKQTLQTQQQQQQRVGRDRAYP